MAAGCTSRKDELVLLPAAVMCIFVSGTQCKLIGDLFKGFSKFNVDANLRSDYAAVLAGAWQTTQV
jgi:hypothetical protein